MVDSQSWLNNIWLCQIENGMDMTTLVTGIRSSVSLGGINEINWFFMHADTNSGKLKVTLIICGSKMGLAFQVIGL